MDNRRIDLHVHSNASDGTFSPSELVNEAKNAGLAAFALTDHDTVSGIAKAKEAAKEAGIELIPGVELSTHYKEKEVHVVGLFIDETNPRLLEHLERFRDNRKNRNQRMYQKLREEGFEISKELLQDMFPDAVLTRAHVARFLMEKGYIKSIPEAFEKYIGEGCRCYVPREKISPENAIRLIHSAGGKAILAHPALYHMSDQEMRELLDNCTACGLDGIEAVYSTYQPDDERYIRKLATEYGLKISGGSDFHGSNKPHIRLGRGTGRLYVPYELLKKLAKEATSAPPE